MPVNRCYAAVSALVRIARFRAGLGRIADLAQLETFKTQISGCGPDSIEFRMVVAKARSRSTTASKFRNVPSGSSHPFGRGVYRAAALSFAVLELMRDTPIRWMGRDGTLLQELDFVSAVSGGSLAAVFFAQDPDRFFSEFRGRVLDLDLQSALWSRALAPFGLWRQTSRTYGRGDLLQELLDEEIFHGKTFGDLLFGHINALSRRPPEIRINARESSQDSKGRTWCVSYQSDEATVEKLAAFFPMPPMSLKFEVRCFNECSVQGEFERLEYVDCWPVQPARTPVPDESMACVDSLADSAARRTA